MSTLPPADLAEIEAALSSALPLHATTEAVRAIVARHLDAEHERLGGAIDEFDPSDAYHRADVRPGYYSALRRVSALLDGEISHWTSPRANP